HRARHAFPTRRSSDLLGKENARTRHGVTAGRKARNLPQTVRKWRGKNHLSPAIHPRRSHVRRHPQGCPSIAGALPHERALSRERSEEHTSELQSRENL